MRRALAVAAAAAVVSTVAVAAVAAAGSRTVYDGPRTSAPTWAEACYRARPRTDRKLLHRCARVRGRVVHVRREHGGETHLALLARWRLVIVKLPFGARAPARGSTIAAVGPLLEIKYGLSELEAFRVEG